jgi:hypothetical protein
MSWYATDTLARNQFRMFSSLGEELRLNEDERRSALLLSQTEWTKWSEFLDEGSLPASPPLPVMLQRIGAASYRLSLLAEQQGMPA